MRALCLLDPPDRVAAGAHAVANSVSGIFRVRLASEPWEFLGYGALRHAVFCREQQLFEQSDLDENDHVATPIVAVSYAAGMAVDVVGAVRIYEQEPGLWIGSRLAIDQDWRGIPSLAAQLVRAAVCTARLRGCHTFMACVQKQNERLFRRLHWESVGTSRLCGVEHAQMRANLRHYPANDRLALSSVGAA
jgi:putative N-acetyltransferase (TIGR04045 family)